MSAGLVFDNRTFRAGLRHKLSLTKKTEAEVLNNAHKDVCLTAIKYTPAAGASEIKTNLTHDGLALKLVQSRSFDRRLPRSLQGFGRAKHTRQEIDDAARKLVALRARSRNNIKAGFIKAAQAVGGALSRKVSAKGNTGKGYGRKATAAKLEAFGVNAANGASLVATFAVQKAMDEVGRKMRSYAPKQIAKIWK